MKPSPRFAVVLSGCGVFDGSEIHEATLTLYAIAKNGGTYEIFAPDVAQYHVVDHLTGRPTTEKRNVLSEAARIARGKITPLSRFNAGSFDALIFPGGFGVAKNLFPFAVEGPDAKVQQDAERAIREMHRAGKPIGALCIAPVLLAKVLGNIEVTIGNDSDTVSLLHKLGANHKVTGHGEVAIDRANKIVTSPCYMLDSTIVQIAEGAERTVQAMMELIGK